MDFARKQLEKYGWTNGKGLGKNENGISEPLRPKIKRSVTGVGHNAAKDFTEHWWTALYDKAAGNVEVEQKNGKTKKIKTKDSSGFEITNSTWKLNRKSKTQNGNDEYKNFFIKTAVLANGGSKVEKLQDSDTDEEVNERKDVFKMTDEELFAACEGRTAHKGARFGLKATGKLARIKQQEEQLLNLDKYNGYSHAKKRKSQNSNEKDTNIDNVTNERKQKQKKDKAIEDVADDPKLDTIVVTLKDEDSCRKRKKRTKNIDIVEIDKGTKDEINTDLCRSKVEDSNNCKTKSKNVEDVCEMEAVSRKKKIKCPRVEDDENIVDTMNLSEEVGRKCKKKYKKKKYCKADNSCDSDQRL